MTELQMRIKDERFRKWVKMLPHNLRIPMSIKPTYLDTVYIVYCPEELQEYLGRLSFVECVEPLGA